MTAIVSLSASFPNFWETAAKLLVTPAAYGQMSLWQICFAEFMLAFIFFLPIYAIGFAPSRKLAPKKIQMGSEEQATETGRDEQAAGGKTTDIGHSTVLTSAIALTTAASATDAIQAVNGTPTSRQALLSDTTMSFQPTSTLPHFPILPHNAGSGPSQSILSRTIRLEFFPITVGAAFGFVVLAGSTTSGAILNPLRALAPAILSLNFSNVWMYWLADLSAAALATLLCIFLSNK